MNTYQTNTVEKAVAHNPPRRPPNQALKKTAGKNRNHTSGCNHDQHSHCTPSATNGGINADHGGSRRRGFIAAAALLPLHSATCRVAALLIHFVDKKKN
jgi:hypothetical protein